MTHLLLLTWKIGTFIFYIILYLSTKELNERISMKWNDTKSLTGREKRIGGFDLIWNEGPVNIDDCSTDQPKLNSFLGELYNNKKKLNYYCQIWLNKTFILIVFFSTGCLNDRDEQLKKLYRQIALNKKTSKSESNWACSCLNKCINE